MEDEDFNLEQQVPKENVIQQVQTVPNAPPPPPPPKMSSLDEISYLPNLPINNVSTIPLRSFFFNPVKMNQLEDSIWTKNNIANTTNDLIKTLDFKSIHELFNMSNPGSSPSTTSPNSSSPNNISPISIKKQGTKDALRSHNISLLLGSLHELLKVLGNHFEILEQVMPSNEELQYVREQCVESANFDEAGQFFSMLIEFRNLPDRVKHWSFMHKFDSTCAAIQNDINKIQNLIKLKDTRATNRSNKTLLQFLIDWIENKHSEVSSFYENLSSVQDASRLSSAVIKNEIMKCKRGISDVDSDYKCMKSHWKDKFFTSSESDKFDFNYFQTIESFVNKAKGKIIQIDCDWEHSRDHLYQMAVLYCEKESGILKECQPWFVMLDRFLSLYKLSLNKYRDDIKKEKERNNRKK
ncbi:tatB [Acrasis kona]|uniref:TatB n=1 Tax=Acrasis kona TaxID=1008807 RepID=A0AAW2Z4V1_9EUKA